VLERNRWCAHDRRMRLLGLLTLAALAACGDNLPAAQGVETLTDTNPDPSIVEVELVAAEGTHEYLAGKPADVWGFRDGARAGSKVTIPGPMLEGKLGDRVIVHFRNDLPEETTIHWHGIRLPHRHDGTPASQQPIPPGGTFDYEFPLMDAGLFWFHPHMRGDVQIERGLYAPLRVLADDGIDVATDRVFVLDDVKVSSTGKLSELTDTLDLMLGRQGNVILVNGESGRVIDVASGSRERWRFVNTANGRYFNLELPGYKFLVVGWDGGLVNTPYETDRLLLTPGERYDVIVEVAGAPGDKLTLRTVHYDRGHNIPDPGPIDLLTVDLGARGTTPAALPATFGSISPTAFDTATLRRRFVLREDDSVPTAPVFTINDEAFPNITPEQASMGTEVWEIQNESEMDHPFHLHGMSFQVLDDAGVPIAPLGWKDTFNVTRETTRRFVVKIDAPGRWMYHCHILEHAERGMMGELEVAP